MKVSDFDTFFDAGGDLSNVLDMASTKRVNVDFPAWMVQFLDREANRLGVTRQSLIKLWIADRLDYHQPG